MLIWRCVCCHICFACIQKIYNGILVLTALYEACSKSLNMICFNSSILCKHNMTRKGIFTQRKSMVIKRQERIYFLGVASPSLSPFLVPQAFHFPDLHFFFQHVLWKRRQRDFLSDLSLNCFHFSPVRWDWVWWEERENKRVGLPPDCITPSHAHTPSSSCYSSPSTSCIPHSHGLCLNFTGESFDRYCPWRGSLCLATESNEGLRVVGVGRGEEATESESDGENKRGGEEEWRVKSY